MRLRKANGLSQADLAGMLAARGFSFQQPMIGKVERGERPLKADELAVIAQILSVRASDLLEDSPVAEAAAAAAQWRNAEAEIAIHRHQIQVHERAIEHLEGLKRAAEASLEASGVAVKDGDGRWHWWAQAGDRKPVLIPADGGNITSDPEAFRRAVELWNAHVEHNGSNTDG